MFGRTYDLFGWGADGFDLPSLLSDPTPGHFVMSGAPGVVPSSLFQAAVDAFFLEVVAGCGIRGVDETNLDRLARLLPSVRIREVATPPFEARRAVNRMQSRRDTRGVWCGCDCLGEEALGEIAANRAQPERAGRFRQPTL